MNYTSLLSTDTYDFPEPSKYDATTSTFVDAGRNTQAITVGAVIREDVAKISISYNFITPDDWSDILKQFNTKYGGNFYRDITFLNQTTGNWETRKFYVSDRTAGLFLRDTETGEIKGYTGAKLSLIEV